ncbi:uncharacterized protein J3D65DRAFT_195788 [Phyllosticta citribraziliensis]|uniref:Uncharacterized protein n=1 Tax=Phyllosticta citribraziliensis TaxID=989973 RepID=A0ABR1M343_9PEZI
MSSCPGRSVQCVQIPHAEGPPRKQPDLGLHISYHVRGPVVDGLELRRLLNLPYLVPVAALLCFALPPFLAVGFHQLELRHNRPHAENDFCRHLCQRFRRDADRRLAPFLGVPVMSGLLLIKQLDIAVGLVDGSLEFGNVVLEGFGLPASADARHSTDASGCILQNLPSGLDPQWPTHHTAGTWLRAMSCTQWTPHAKNVSICRRVTPHVPEALCCCLKLLERPTV